MLKGIGKIIKNGGWAPLAVLGLHLFLSKIVHAYILWPQTDIPVHFLGGLSIAYFVSQCFQTLPRETTRNSRLILLEIILIISLTVTAAVLWEFAEFTKDQLFGTNIQVSLANTMQDQFMGLLGATVFAAMRYKQLRAGFREVKEVTGDWVSGQAA